MIRTDKSSWSRGPLLYVCFTGLLPLLAYLFEKGAISAKQLGAGFLLLAGCLFVIILYRYSRGRRRENKTSMSRLELTDLKWPVLLERYELRL